MKRIEIALTTAIFTAFMISCSSEITAIKKESYYNAIDFTRFTDRGFLITPEKFQGEYESIGMVKYTTVPGARYATVKTTVLSDGRQEATKQWITEPIDADAGIDSLYSMSRRMGANAIINFRAELVTRSYNSINPITLTGIEYSGFAIRRKQK